VLSLVVENCRRGAVPPASPPPPAARVSTVAIHVTQRSATSVGAVGVPRRSRTPPPARRAARSGSGPAGRGRRGDRRRGRRGRFSAAARRRRRPTSDRSAARRWSWSMGGGPGRKSATRSRSASCCSASGSAGGGPNCPACLYLRQALESGGAAAAQPVPLRAVSSSATGACRRRSRFSSCDLLSRAVGLVRRTVAK
jgi:hypothetical protein